MKKLTLLIAALVLSFTAQAVTHNVSSSFSWWVAGDDSPVQAGDTLLVADGEYVEQWSIDFQKSDLVVMAAEGAKPVIKASSYLKIHATTTFEGITFDGLNTATYAIGSRGTEEKNLTLKNCEFKNYVDCDINIYESTSINKLTIDSCVFDGTNTTPIAIYGKGSTSELTITNSEFKNYTEYCITANDYYKGYFEKVSISNSLFHDSKYSAIYLYQATEGNSQSCTDFQLTNSTIYNIGNNPTETDLPKRAVVEIRGNSTQQVLVDHVTIYNFPAPDYCGAIKIENSSNATISNCIVMNPDDIYTKWITPFLAYAGAIISNSVYYNCNITSSATATQEDLTQADPMFVDAANGNFQLYAESPAIGLGDPRWGVKAGIQPGEGKLKAAVDAAEDGATIILGDETYEVSTSIEFNKEGLTIVAAEGTKPVIKLVDEGGNSSLKLSATTTFNGITFDGNNITKYPVTSTGTDASQFTFVNCEFKNYTKWAITNEYRSSHVDNVIIDKCLFHDGGSAVYFNSNGYNGQHSCSYFKMTNTTIYNINYDDWGVGVIHVSAKGDATGEQNEVEIDHITMYNVSTKEYGAITVRKSSKLSVTNSIIANPASNSDKYAFYIYGGNVTNTLYHNSKVNSEAPTMTTINKDPLFVNAAENNFDLYANSPAVGAGTDGSNLGDTRWGVSDKTIGTGKRVNVTTADVESFGWIVNNAASNLQPGDTLVLADGTYTLSTIAFSKENVVVMAAENAKPVIANASEWACLELSASTTFDGITFDAGNVAHYIIASKGAASGKFAFVNCEFKGWTTWAISNQYEAGTHVDSVIVDNCLFHDGLGGAISFSGSAPENQQSCQYFKMTNTTLYNLTESSYRGIINVGSNPEEEGKYNEVVIDHITMYNYELTESGIAAIAVRKSTDLKITNSIIANPEDKGYTALNVYGGTVDNTIHYNGSKRSGNTVYTKCENIDPLFVDAANNDFMLQANSPAIGKATDGSNLGDPRWGVEEPTLITLTTGDNDAVIEANIDKTVNVKIERSFTANDGYYTLCVPFNMPASVIGKAYSLGTITKHVTGEGININLEEESELSAGVPYLVLPKANMSELVVENVTILSDMASGQNITKKELNVQIFFEGFYSASGQTNGSTEYYVGNNGYLYNEVVEKRGLCGLFTITDAEGEEIKNVRARVVTREEVETGLDNNQLPNTNIQKVLENGQLIIIRDGVKYNVQGQVI